MNDLKIKFWRENKQDQEFELTISELKEKFFTWIKTKEKDWLQHYGCYQCYQVFVGDKTGLNSVSDMGEAEGKFCTFIKREFWDYADEENR